MNCLFRQRPLATTALALLIFVPSLSAGQSPFDTLNAETANLGLYSNRITAGAPMTAYTEICFRAGEVFNDQHAAGEPTADGNCVVGDVGWVIEKDERPAAAWEQARTDCLVRGMRLPEPFEFKYACTRAAEFALDNMVGGFEWASNTATPQFGDSRNGIASVIMGGDGCADGAIGWIADSDEFESVGPYRCVR